MSREQTMSTDFGRFLRRMRRRGPFYALARAFAAWSHRRDRTRDASEIRRLGPGDTLALAMHYATLTPEDRYARFNGHPKFVTLLRQARATATNGETALGIFEGDRLVAVAEIVPVDGPTPMSEIALSVRKPWQRRHYGQSLLQQALEVARADGRMPMMYARHDNTALIRLALSEGGEVSGDAQDVEILFPEAEPAAAGA